MVSQLCNTNKLTTKILDIGCGKGYVGEYLRNDGYQYIIGMDYSKKMLDVAATNKAYKSLER